MNGFNPEVQNFMLSLINEVLDNYKVDGIQGDDRMPAMPTLAGYDAYTVGRYKSEHNNAEPPTDYKNSAWIEWRAKLMDDFMQRIFDDVQQHNLKRNSSVTVEMSPSIYPFAKTEYLQDWPVWVEKGWLDMALPQVYRYNIADYRSCLAQISSSQVKKSDLARIAPGVLIKVGKYDISDTLLQQMLEANHEYGFKSEAYFFYSGLAAHKDLIKNFYTTGGKTNTKNHLTSTTLGKVK